MEAKASLGQEIKHLYPLIDCISYQSRKHSSVEARSLKVLVAITRQSLVIAEVKAAVNVIAMDFKRQVEDRLAEEESQGKAAFPLGRIEAHPYLIQKEELQT